MVSQASISSSCEQTPTESLLESSNESSSLMRENTFGQKEVIDRNDEDQSTKKSNHDQELIKSPINTNHHDDKIKTLSRPVDKRLLALAAFLALVFIWLLFIYVVFGKQISLVFLTFSFGLLVGALATGVIFYLALKFDLLKYFFAIKQTTTKPTDETDNPKEENVTISQLQALLIQTPIQKENRNFHGVYKVREYFSLFFFNSIETSTDHFLSSIFAISFDSSIRKCFNNYKIINKLSLKSRKFYTFLLK